MKESSDETPQQWDSARGEGHIQREIGVRWGQIYRKTEQQMQEDTRCGENRHSCFGALKGQSRLFWVRRTFRLWFLCGAVNLNDTHNPPWISKQLPTRTKCYKSMTE